MRNEAALIEGLTARGFQIVTPGSLSLPEQVAVFKRASFVVGPHGAGLSNVVFCQPGAMLYEILPAAYDNACFCNLALASDMQYWADAFHSDGAAGVDLFQRDWESNTTQVLARVDEIMWHLRAQRERARTEPISAMDFLRGKDGVPSDRDTPPTPPAAPVGAFRRFLRRLFGRG